MEHVFVNSLCKQCEFSRVKITLTLILLQIMSKEQKCGIAGGTWQFCVHDMTPCGFNTFLCVSVATRMTVYDVDVTR